MFTLYRVLFNFYLMMLIMPSLILICSFVNKKVKQNKCFKFKLSSLPNVNDLPDRMVNPWIIGMRFLNIVILASPRETNSQALADQLLAMLDVNNTRVCMST